MPEKAFELTLSALLKVILAQVAVKADGFKMLKSSSTCDSLRFEIGPVVFRANPKLVYVLSISR